MVNTGRPSRGCSVCKGRKIKCDETKPACSRCLMSGWVCPGYKSKAQLIFRDQTDSVIRKELQRRPERPSQSLPAETRVREVSPSTVDRATSFFIYQYVFKGQASLRGNHEYLPALLQEDSGGTLGTIIAAAGLAGLANAGNATTWRPEAYSLYGRAIRQLKIALDDPVQVKADQTLAAIMLMGTFETIASADADSMKSFGQHIVAAARCIELRGPFQFRNEASVKMFLQLRRLIVMTYHQFQENIPHALKQWSSWAEPIQRKDESPANRFSELNDRLAAVRAKIKHDSICTPSVVASLLLSMDNELESWRSTLPPSWEYRSCKSFNPSTNTYESHYDVYSDLWVASMWNNYRSVRLMIYEHIMCTTLKYGLEEDKELLQIATTVLRAMADDVCRSAQFHLGHQCQTDIEIPDEIPDDVAIPGGYLLMWPLYLSGMLLTTPTAQKRWIASKLRQIGVRMGLRLAFSMSENLLRMDNNSFSENKVRFIGEWYPK
ncbi:hypothetical protein V8E54_010138 [Elaphomyces granulatus]